MANHEMALAARQRFAALRAIVRQQLERKWSCIPFDLSNPTRKEIEREAVSDRERRGGGRLVRNGKDFFAPVLDAAKSVLGELLKGFACRRQAQRIGLAIDQARTDPGLEALDATAKR